MRKTEQTPEPSIEEILASIRRIIADDGMPTAGPVFDPFSTDADYSNSYFSGTSDGGHAEAGPSSFLARSITSDMNPSGGSKREDEILELTEDFMVEELGGFAEALAEDATPPAPDDGFEISEHAPTFAACPSEDIPEGLPADESPLSDDGLEDLSLVLSNVAAEMQRRAHDRKAEARPQASAPVAPPPPPEASAPAPIPAPVAAPSARQPGAAVQKPVWSARHHADTAKGRSANGTAARTETAPPPPPTSGSDDGTATGVSPLMEAIATSLVTALAQNEEARAASAAIAQEIVQPPEDEFAPDPDGTLADASAGGAAATPAVATETPAPAVTPAPATTIGFPREVPRTAPAPAVATPIPVNGANPSPAATATAAEMQAPVEAAQIALPASLDDKVREMLKPLLVAWLNEHLPRLVEKTLRDEIASHGSLSLRGGKTGGLHG